MKLPYERGWYPVSHTYDNKKIEPSELGEAFKSTDWKNDKVWEPNRNTCLTSIFSSDHDWQVQNNLQITNNLTIIDERKPVIHRELPIHEYVATVYEMFDAHMTSLVEQHKGKYCVLSSGGIDGNSIAAWMYKNKLDFEVVGFHDAPFHGKLQQRRNFLSISELSKKIPARIHKLDSHLVVKNYIKGDEDVNVPQPPNCYLNGYDMDTNKQMLEHNDWIIRGAGSNHTMLHHYSGTLRAFLDLDKKWKAYQNMSIFQKTTFPGIVGTGYNEELSSGSLRNYIQEGWLDRPVRHNCLSGWNQYSRLFQKKDDRHLTLVNQSWWDIWETIDWTKLDMALLNKLLGAEIWLERISQTLGENVSQNTKTGNGDTACYKPNEENYIMIGDRLKSLKQRFTGNIRLIGEVMAAEYLLEKYQKATYNTLMLCNMESFLQR